MRRRDVHWGTEDDLASAQADCTALIVLLTRHRDRLTALERATVDAIAGRHGHVVPTAGACTTVHIPRSASRIVDDPLAGMTPEQRAACDAELAMMRQGR